MRKLVWLLVCCSLICIGAHRWGDAKWENAKMAAIEHFYMELSQHMMPYIYSYEKDSKKLVYEDVEQFFVPLMSEFRATKYQAVVKEEIGQGNTIGSITSTGYGENSEIVELPQANENTESNTDETQESVTVAGNPSVLEKRVIINRTKLQEFDYLRQNFYQIDNTTTIGSDQLDARQFLEKDMTLKQNVEGPQILIYHTHSKEAYKDSTPGDESMTVVGVGDYLEALLEQKYGIEVLHHKGQFDAPTRDNAYSNALPNIEKILQENPSIEVVIDLHRDGVPENRHLATEINGKPTAQIMFFNGLSRTTSQGELTYLPNPYIADNLALSFQMQLAAAEYYPGLTRRI